MNKVVKKSVRQARSLLLVVLVLVMVGLSGCADQYSQGEPSKWIFVVFLVASGLLALIPATIASEKGKDFFTWWLYGFFLLFFAFFHSLSLKPLRLTRYRLENQQKSDGMKQCQYCAEMVKPAAKICRYCSKDFVAPDTKPFGFDAANYKPYVKK